MEESRVSSMSKASTLKEMGEFWDAHDFTEYDDMDLPDVEFEISATVAIEPDLLSAMERQAKMRGVTVETLINLWLHEKLVEQRQVTQDRE